MSSAPIAPPPPPPVPEQPDVAIRTRPPSPKRLSRKVLMGAALLGAAIVTFALMSGLSGNRIRNGEGVEQEAVAASGGPPESIAQASSQYGSGDLPRGHAELGTELDPAEELAPPQDPMWREAAPPHVGRGAGESGASTAAPPPSPRRSRAPRPSSSTPSPTARAQAQATPAMTTASTRA